MLSVWSHFHNRWEPTNPIIFPGGEVHTDIMNVEKSAYYRIKADIRNSNDVMALLMLTDALRRFSIVSNPGIELYMPYLPYARQDREQEGFSLSLKVFCDLINSQEYRRVTILDCHSDVGPALLNNSRNIPVEDLVPSLETLKLAPGTYVVAPDQGAYKKCARVAAKLGLPLISAQKKRDPKTGKVELSFREYDDLYSAQHGTPALLVVDDICDGGMTFKLLADQVADKVDIRLWVTHGIFSKGLEPLKRYSKIYTANNWSENLTLSEGKLQEFPYVY